MAERLTPGVYIEEIPSAAKTILGVATSTAGFVGEAGRGIPNQATFVNGFREFDRLFGGHRRGEAGFLAQAVQNFFDAGGRRAFIVRVLPANAGTGGSLPVDARALDAWGNRHAVLRFDARGNGAWSEHLRINVEPSSSFPGAAFRVRVEWTEAGRSRTVETFDNVRMDPEHPDYAVDLINDGSRYIRAVDLFQTEFLDLDPRPLPSLPERVPALDTDVAQAGGFSIPEGATLEFRWSDAASGAGIDADSPAVVTFDNAAIAGVGGALAGGTADLTAVQLRDLMAGALGNEFRVSIPSIPAALISEVGPFDTTDGNPAIVAIDGNPRNLVFQQTTSASMDLGGGPLGVNAGEDLVLTVDGVDQTYALVAGDVAGGGTIAELVTLLNREFTGIQAFDQAGNLILRTDSLGPGATLAVGGAAAAGMGNPAAAQGAGNVADPAAVTADEVAAVFNAIPANSFEARVSAGRVTFVQIDLSTAGSIQWQQDPGPDVMVAEPAVQNGPAVPANPSLRVEPAVASRAYMVVHPTGGAADFDLNAIDTITLTAADGVQPDQVLNLDVAGSAAMIPAALADALQSLIDAAPDNAFGLEVEDNGSDIVVTAGPAAAGIDLSLAADAAPDPWAAPQREQGRAGVVIDSQAGVEISVSEPFQPGVERVLSGTPPLFTAVRAIGLEQNSPGNPDLRPAETDDTPIRLFGGTDGSGSVTESQYTGSVTAAGRTGLRAFDTVDLGMLVLPGRNQPGFMSAAMAYCDRNDVFLVADGIGSIDQRFQASASDVRQSVEGLPTRSNNAAMFYPWIEVPDPVGIGRNPRRLVPPSGHVAGIFARTDATRGVWKAPAGIEAVVSGAVGLQHDLVDADQDLLNPIGLNCIRRFPDAGIVSWGSRTLASDPEWRYVPVRRTALFLKKSLRLGLKWAVFEPNDQELWDRIRININAFMLGLFRQGAFQGASPDEAFQVKCDRETNPQELVDQGIVMAQVAFAPLKPAEFVVIEISQKALIA